MDQNYIFMFSNPENGSFVVSSYTTDGNTTPNSPILLSTSAFAHTTLDLVGKGLPNYGQLIQSNLIHMTEHFFSPSAPTNPIPGQLWYCQYNYWFNAHANQWYEWSSVTNTWSAVNVSTTPPPVIAPNGYLLYNGSILTRYTTPVDGSTPYSYVCEFVTGTQTPTTQHPERSLKIYEDTKTWRDVRDVYQSTVPPHDSTIGKLWYDQNTGVFGTNTQLRVYNGTEWVSVGANYLPTAGGSMNPNSTLTIPSNSTLAILKAPILSTDAINLGYVNTNFLNLSGTIAMQGGLNMNGFPIHNVGNPQAPGDAINFGTANNTYFNYRTGGAILGNVVLSSTSTLSLLASASLPTDAVNKQYVDTSVATAVATLEAQPITTNEIVNNTSIGGSNLTSALQYLNANMLNTTTGGVVSGTLLVTSNPVLPLQVSTKGYVDSTVRNLSFPNTYVIGGLYDSSNQSISLTRNDGGIVTISDINFNASEISFTPNTNTLLDSTITVPVNTFQAIEAIDQIIRARTNIRRTVRQIIPEIINSTTYTTRLQTTSARIYSYAPALSGFGTLNFSASNSNNATGTITFTNGVTATVSYEALSGAASGVLVVNPVSTQNTAPSAGGTILNLDGGYTSSVIAPDGTIHGGILTFTDGSSGQIYYTEATVPNIPGVIQTNIQQLNYGSLTYINTSNVTTGVTNSYSATGEITGNTGVFTFAGGSSGDLTISGSNITYNQTFTSVTMASSGTGTLVATVTNTSTGNFTLSDGSSGIITYDTTANSPNVTYVETAGPIATYNNVFVISGNTANLYQTGYILSLYDTQMNYIGSYTISSSGAFNDSTNTVLTITQSLPSGGNIDGFSITPITLQTLPYATGRNILSIYKQGSKLIGDMQGSQYTSFKTAGQADFPTNLLSTQQYSVNITVDGVHNDTANFTGVDAPNMSNLVTILNQQFTYCTVFYDSVLGDLVIYSNSHGPQSSINIQQPSIGYLFSAIANYAGTSTPASSLVIDYLETGKYNSTSNSVILTQPVTTVNIEMITQG